MHQNLHGVTTDSAGRPMVEISRMKAAGVGKTLFTLRGPDGLTVAFVIVLAVGDDHHVVVHQVRCDVEVEQS